MTRFRLFHQQEPRPKWHLHGAAVTTGLRLTPGDHHPLRRQRCKGAAAGDQRLQRCAAQQGSHGRAVAAWNQRCESSS